MKKRLLVARVYLDNIHYLDRISFHRKMFKAIKEALEEQYEHRLTVDKRVLIAHILSMKFYNDYHIELLLSEYNNLNFLLSILMFLKASHPIPAVRGIRTSKCRARDGVC